MAHILLIEDNPIDARLMQRMIDGRTTWIDDGEKALWYLRCLESGGVDDPPSLVLLDMNLPKYDGLEVLEQFRSSAALRHLPVFLLSSAPAYEIAGEAESRNLRADAYIEKPRGLSEFEDLAARVREAARLSFSEARTAAAQRRRLQALRSQRF